MQRNISGFNIWQNILPLKLLLLGLKMKKRCHMALSRKSCLYCRSTLVSLQQGHIHKLPARHFTYPPQLETLLSDFSLPWLNQRSKERQQTVKMVKPPWPYSIMYPSPIKMGTVSICLGNSKHELLYKGLYERGCSLPSPPSSSCVLLCFMVCTTDYQPSAYPMKAPLGINIFKKLCISTNSC